MNNFVKPALSGNAFFSVGLDVHKSSIAVCVFEPLTGAVVLEQTIANQASAIGKLFTRLTQRFGPLRCCYEASSCGFVLYRLLRTMDIDCDVIAPSLIPRRVGDRVKTDRRDATKLATLYAAGVLTPVHVPTPEEEAARALVRCRASLVEELTRAKKRTTQFLLTRGYSFGQGTNWSQRFHAWLTKIELSTIDQRILDTYVAGVDYLQTQIRSLEEAIDELARTSPYDEAVKVLRAFRGIDTITAMTLLLEIGDIRRFASPRQLMAYLGLVPSEHSSGEAVYRGSITKAGNSHARKAIVSAAWKYTARPCRSHALKQRQREVPAALAPRVIATSWKAQHRLYKRFHALVHRKPRSVANVAIARELTGFLWEAMQLLSSAPLAEAA